MAEGRVLAGRYRLHNKLGAGGMGSVWRATDLTLKSEVAIKLIDSSMAESQEALARFEREAQAAAAIRSTHVVQILDYGADGTCPFIAMELLAGESLSDRLTRQGRLGPKETSHILNHVARALSLAHQRGIVHRDLKPENIFIVHEEDEDIAKVLDFGIARRTSVLAEAVGIKTQTGAILGTPYYMSPEQATGQAVDHSTDIWSFGVIAFECLTGKRAFDGESLGSLFHAVCMAELPVPSAVAAVPRGFDEWFRRVTARNKAERFTSIREAAETLRNVCSNTFVGFSAERDQPQRASRPPVEPLSTLDDTAPPSSLTIPGVSQRNYRNLTWAFGLGFALLLAGGAFYVFARGKSDRSTTSVSSAPPSVSLIAEVSVNSAPSASGSALPNPTAHANAAPSITPSVDPQSAVSPTQKPDPSLHPRPAKSKSKPAVDNDNVAAF